MPTISGAVATRLLALDFAENTGITTYDRSGNGNNGTLTNATWTSSGKYGKAISFNKTSGSHVSVGSSASLVPSNLSLSVWIYPTGPGGEPTYGASIFAKEGNYEIYRYPSGQIWFLIKTTSPGWVIINTGLYAPLNTWTHLVMTYNQGAGVAKVYKNNSSGSATFSIPMTGPILDNDSGTQNQAWIGGRSSTPCCDTPPGHYFDGIIDELAIYNRALTATEITNMYNNTAFNGTHTINVQATDAAAATATDSNTFSIAVTPITISSFTATPSSMTLPTNSTTLTWTTTGSPTSCTGSNAWSGAKAVGGGSENRTGLTAGSYTYTLTCSKAGLPNAVTSVTVTVGSAPTVDINASPTSIYGGDSTTLTWSSSAASCAGTNFNTGGASSGSVIVNPTSTATYSVLCGGVSDSVTVTVRKKPFFIED